MVVILQKMLDLSVLLLQRTNLRATVLVKVLNLVLNHLPHFGVWFLRKVFVSVRYSVILVQVKLAPHLRDPILSLSGPVSLQIGVCCVLRSLSQNSLSFW